MMSLLSELPFLPMGSSTETHIRETHNSKKQNRTISVDQAIHFIY